jgi:hypothetical protein
MERSNRYDPRAPFNDDRSHFMRMNKEDIENYFATGGVVDREEGLPNWVVRAPDGSYELARTGHGDDLKFGFFITITPKAVNRYEGEGGKAVATWNYSVSVPLSEEAASYQLFSDDSLKYVFAYPGAQVAAIPPRMRQMHQQLSTMRMRNQQGTIPLIPYVNLAFLMWLEDESQGKSTTTLNWLSENMEGWRA